MQPPKKIRKKERWSEEKKAAAKAVKNVSEKTAEDGDKIDREDKKADTKKKKQKKNEEVKIKSITTEDIVSGPGNADEANAMRATLGILDQQKRQSEFQFGFTASPAPQLGGDAKADEGSDSPTSSDSSDESSSGDSDSSSSSTSIDSSTSDDDRDELNPEEGKKIAIHDKKEEPLNPTNAEVDPDGFIPRRIFVGGMPFGYSEEMVREYWEYCGPIETLDIMVFPDTGRFKGIAFITFATQEAYESALQYDGADCDGQIIKVQKCKADLKKRPMPKPQDPAQSEMSKYPTQTKAPLPAARSPAPKTAGYNVAYVGNIAFEANAENVEALFEPYGVTRVRLHTDKDTGKPKGYAHVHFPYVSRVNLLTTHFLPLYTLSASTFWLPSIM